MRTTLDIGDDILAAARELSRQRSQTIGAVITELARAALQRQTSKKSRHGVPLLPARKSPPVTMELVNRLRDRDA